MLRVLAAGMVLTASLAAQAQAPGPANGLFLVAKPSLVDPNFSRTVVLVTQAEDASTVGVIINRPSKMLLSQFHGGALPTENYKEAMYFGGPVMRHALLAVFRADEPPKAAAFHVLKGLYLTMHEANVTALLADPKARYRLYAGFSGWAPRQLESEFQRDGWYFVQADEATVFRKDMKGLWEELVAKASGPRTSLSAD